MQWWCTGTRVVGGVADVVGQWWHRGTGPGPCLSRWCTSGLGVCHGGVLVVSVAVQWCNSGPSGGYSGVIVVPVVVTVVY